jgi:hypothetical protein
VLFELIVERLRILVELFDEGVDVLFAPGSIQPALVERIFQTLPKPASLVLDSIQQPRDFPIADAVWLSHNLAGGTGRKRGKHQ